MSTIRAATVSGGLARRAYQSAQLRTLFQRTLRGGFLLPTQWSACEHDWRCLDSGYAICGWCGDEHWCGQGDCPEAISDSSHDHVCTITGCVTVECEFRAERNAGDRVGPSAAASGVLSNSLQPGRRRASDRDAAAPLETLHYEEEDEDGARACATSRGRKRPRSDHSRPHDSNTENARSRPRREHDEDEACCCAPAHAPPPAQKRLKRLRRGILNTVPKHRHTAAHAPCAAGGTGETGGCAGFTKISDLLRTGSIRCDLLHDMIETTVREILLSDKTQRCIEQEKQRNETKELAVFAKLLRETAHDRQCLRPNMVLLLGQVAFQCRKNRRVLSLHAFYGSDTAERVVRQCTEAIAGLLLVHGGPRVARQIQNASRYREFIASMLFLMRAGISFQGRQVLPQMDILHQVLPLQVLLPPVFQIRAKSITEGENLVKLDMKRLPM